MEHCSSLPLWRPDRRVQQISGGTGHRPSRSDVPCRDDGSGQTARWVVATRPRVRRLVGLFLNGHPQVAASRRPRTEASARRSDNAKEGLTTDGPLQKPILAIALSVCEIASSTLRFTWSSICSAGVWFSSVKLLSIPFVWQNRSFPSRTPLLFSSGATSNRSQGKRAVPAKPTLAFSQPCDSRKMRSQRLGPRWRR